MAVKIITDSVSDLPGDLKSAYGIEVLPLMVNFGDESYRDGIDLTPEAFFEKLKAAETLPTTSQVNVGQFVTCYEQILEAGDEAVVITLSSKLSGTYSAAVTAAEEAGAGRISVLDSKFVSFAQGMLVLKAAEMAKAGQSREEIVAGCQKLIDQLELIIFVDTLTYLHKGGRLSAGQAVIGGLLGVKPILTVKDGALVPLDKVRGRNKSLKWFDTYLQERSAEISEDGVGFFHAADPGYMEEMVDVASGYLKTAKIYRSTVGPVVGTHSGPGCVAFAYFRKS